jgi:hypothetical protein
MLLIVYILLGKQGTTVANGCYAFLCPTRTHSLTLHNGAAMLNKRLLLLTLFFIVIFALIFRFVYPEVQVTQVMTVISLTALLASLGVNFVIQQIQQKRGASDENKKS